MRERGGEKGESKSARENKVMKEITSTSPKTLYLAIHHHGNLTR
jgi:hypothetical protein